MQAILETPFHMLYLATVITLGVLMIRGSRGRTQYRLFGIMAVVLGCGDAFHLIPRIWALCSTGLQDYPTALGIGKLVTSMTMTVFYVLLYHIWRTRYRVKGQNQLTFAVYALAIVRVALCLMPQNAWTSAQPPLSWGIYRNIPFTLLGALLILCYYRSAKAQNDRPFAWLWLSMTLSFACYLPVVLFAETVPAVGILMIPKTCAYIWMVVIGYRAMLGEKPDNAA